MPEKMKTVREHADEVIGKMVKDGKIAPDAEAAKLASGLPVFSKGTASLDPNTGEPIIPGVKTPEFTEGRVAIPEEEQSAGAVGDSAAPAPVAEAERTAEQILADHKTRLAEASPTEGQAAPDESAAVPAQAAGTAAAEVAAQAVVADDEYEDFEFEDPDLEVKIPLRVRKQFADVAKRGYGRRAAYDRAVSYLKGADPVLRQLIEDGRINQILPLIDRAIKDPAYGDYVWGGYDRLNRGLPLVEQAAREAAAAGQPQPQAQEFNAGEYDFTDPFIAEQVRPLQTQLQTVTQTLEQIQARERYQQEQYQQQQRLNTERGAQLQAAHMDLTRSFPEEYSGDLQRDDALWRQVLQYGRDSGYIDAYGIRAGLVFAGQQVHLMGQERQAATASPSAAALDSAELQRLARKQAGEASRTVGAGAPTQAPPPAPLPKPDPKKADGTMKPAGEYLREVQVWQASQKQPA